MCQNCVYNVAYSHIASSITTCFLEQLMTKGSKSVWTTKSSLACCLSPSLVVASDLDVRAEANIARLHIGLSKKYTSALLNEVSPFHTVNTDALSAVNTQGSVSACSLGGNVSGWRRMSWQTGRSWWLELRIFNVGRATTNPEGSAIVTSRRWRWWMKFRRIS